MTIAILLATYNGMERLPHLLDSILAQTNNDWTIFVHDDGSTDGTLHFLKTFSAEHPERMVVLGEDVKHLGAKMNFCWLLNNVEADYYMFCDQDDEWLPNKVEDTLALVCKTETESPGLPVCVHTDLAVCDANYNVVHPSLWKLSKVNPSWQEDPSMLLVANCVTGCTMMFNEKVKALSANVPDVVPMHDFWVAYQTASNGGVLTHLPKATILYCQHGGNEVGANNVGLGYVSVKLLGLKNVWKANCQQYNMAQSLAKMSVFRYVWLKFVFEVKRMF